MLIFDLVFNAFLAFFCLVRCRFFFFPSLLSNALRYFSLQPNESEILYRIRCIIYVCSNDDPSFHHSYCIFKLKFNLCTFNSLVLTHEYCYITCLKTFIHFKPFRATMKIKKKTKCTTEKKTKKLEKKKKTKKKYGKKRSG